MVNARSGNVTLLLHLAALVDKTLSDPEAALGKAADQGI